MAPPSRRGSVGRSGPRFIQSMEPTSSTSRVALLPAELSGHTVESLYAMHGPERRWIYWLVLLGVAAALASLPLIQVDVGFRARGVVRPVTDRVDLKTTISGRIDGLLAADNQFVYRGQPLLVIDTGEIDEQLRRQRELAREAEAMVADLRRLAEEGWPDAAWRTAAVRQEARQHQAQLDTYRLAEAKAASELARYTTLAERGIATRQELDNARYELERLQAESRLLQEQARARWAARLRDEEARRADVDSTVRQLEEARERHVVRAPVEGTLVGFSGWAGGGRVVAGQSLGAVSPAGELCVESRVSSGDIGLVRIGQVVRLQVDAFPYTQWGTLEARVESVSADFVADAADAPPHFKVLLRPQTTHLALPGGVRGDLKKGLTLTARYVVGRRSLLQILYDDAHAWLSPQMAAAESSVAGP
jgi:multidrug resistance efflux pump